jgi:hypothetical protein
MRSIRTVWDEMCGSLEVTPLKRIMVFTLMLISIAACSAKQDMAVAEKGIDVFRQKLAEGKFVELYAEASDELKKASSEQDFVRLLETVNNKLGPTVKSTETNWNVNLTTGGTFVTIAKATKFQHGVGDETFVYRIIEKKAYLVAYHINSNDLLTK